MELGLLLYLLLSAAVSAVGKLLIIHSYFILLMPHFIAWLYGHGKLLPHGRWHVGNHWLPRAMATYVFFVHGLGQTTKPIWFNFAYQVYNHMAISRLIFGNIVAFFVAILAFLFTSTCYTLNYMSGLLQFQTLNKPDDGYQCITFSLHLHVLMVRIYLC